MRRIILALGILLALGSSHALAQHRHELSAFGNWANLSGGGGTRDHDWDYSFFNVNYGYHFGPQLVGTAGYQRLNNVGDKNYDILEGGAKFYFGEFRQGNFLPFIDGAISLADFNGNDLGWRVGVGGSYMVSDRTSIDPYFTYMRLATGDNLRGHLFGVRFTTRF